jgi:hypothetical protein
LSERLAGMIDEELRCLYILYAVETGTGIRGIEIQ